MWLGFRWGMGHSLGLLLVALFFIGVKQHVDLRSVSHHLNIVVGLFMVGLGLHGIWSAVRERYFSSEEEDFGKDTINSPSETDGLLKSEDLEGTETSTGSRHITCTCCPCGACNHLGKDLKILLIFCPKSRFIFYVHHFRYRRSCIAERSRTLCWGTTRNRWTRRSIRGTSRC